jgi:hypothetical protein
MSWNIKEITDCIVLNAWTIVSIELAGIWKEAAMYAEGSSTLKYHNRNCLDGLRKTKKSFRTMSKPRFKPNNFHEQTGLASSCATANANVSVVNLIAVLCKFHQILSLMYSFK